jgi:hypothetical protein
MQDQPKNKEKYSLDWFKDRAFSSIKKISEGVFDYSDSLLLYIPGSDEKYESIQYEGNPYHEMITIPERKYLQNIMKDVVARLPENFEYIDLGPGSEHKEQYTFDEILKQGKKCIYRPVDISERFLNRAREHAEQQGITTDPVRASFEELPGILKKSDKPRFVSLGLTYPNYNPYEIFKILANIAGSDGYVLIGAQIRERIDIKRIVEIYAKDTISFSIARLKLIGLDAEEDLEDFHTNDGVQVWGTLKKVTLRLAEMGLKAGDKILLFQSLRPSMDKLKLNLNDAGFSSYTMFDIGESFVNILLEKPLKQKKEEKSKEKQLLNG